MPDDAELLRRYAEEKSEAAFAELVERHLGLVYSAAQRQVGGDAHHAQDVAQTVFTTLARNAASVARHPVLVGWLYTTTQHVAAKVRRSEGRRHAREHAAQLMHELTSPDSPAVEWEQLRPLLDDAMRELSDRDREAVLLRFFAKQPFAEIGAALHLSEDAARMHVGRALEKLGVLLARRGITSTASALGVALANQAVLAAPAGLAASITGAAVTTNAGAAAAGLFSFMSTTQIASAIAVMAALVAMGVAIHNVREARLAEAVLAAAVQENTSAAARVRELSRRADAEVQQIVALQKAAAERSQAASAARVQAVPAPPVEDPAVRAGRELLATNPEARRLVDRIVRSSAERNHGATLRAMGLPAEERERIIAASVADIDTGRISFPGASFDYGREHPELQRDAWQRVLGSENFQRFEELRRKDRTNAIVKTIATATYESDTPLLPAQARALSEIIERRTTLQKTDTTLLTFALDWGAIGKDAEGVLSAPQAALFTAALRQGAPAIVKQEIPSR
jgi:RNA polymerase sigma factor (sigma-70 family)